MLIRVKTEHIPLLLSLWTHSTLNEIMKHASKFSIKLPIVAQKWNHSTIFICVYSKCACHHLILTCVVIVSCLSIDLFTSETCIQLGNHLALTQAALYIDRMRTFHNRRLPQTSAAWKRSPQNCRWLRSQHTWQCIEHFLYHTFQENGTCLYNIQWHFWEKHASLMGIKRNKPPLVHRVCSCNSFCACTLNPSAYSPRIWIYMLLSCYWRITYETLWFCGTAEA